MRDESILIGIYAVTHFASCPGRTQLRGVLDDLVQQTRCGNCDNMSYVHTAVFAKMSLFHDFIEMWFSAPVDHWTI